MENQKPTYYYQEVEAAIEMFKNTVATISSVEGIDKLPQLKELSNLANSFSSFSWSKHPSVANLNLTDEELTAEQKESIALGNKALFDEGIRGARELSEMVNTIIKKINSTQAAKNALAQLKELFITFILDYNLDSQEANEKRTGLTLTAEEVYSALKCLDNKQVRLVLSEQKPQVFDKFFSAYLNGKESFLTAIKSVDYVPMKSLRDLLYQKFQTESKILFNDFISSKVLEDSFLLSMLYEDFITDENDSLAMIIDSLVMGDKLSDVSFDLESLLVYYDKATSKLFYCLYTMIDWPRAYKKKFEKIYNEWRNDGPTLDELVAQEKPLSISQKLVDIVFSLQDEWILNELNEKLHVQNDKLGQCSIHEEPIQIVPSIIQRLSFPTRISRNRPMELDVKKRILDGLYMAFGSNLENYDGDPITKEEFSYLFGGPVKRPDNYKAHYYWNTSDKQFAGLLRLLYFGQETGIDEIILLSIDKYKKKSSVKWSARKQGLGKITLQPIEEQIQNIIVGATGERLPEVDLTKQNKPKNK